MSYIDTAVIDNGAVVKVWERDENDNLITHDYNAEYYCYVPDERGEQSTIFPDRFSKATRYNFDNRYNLKKFVKDHLENHPDIPLFESDIPPDLRILSDFYYKQPVPNIHITFFDIETDADLENRGDWPTIADPYGDVISIALYHHWKDEIVVIATPPEGYDGPLYTAEELGADRVIYTDNEAELLGCFLEEIENSDILSGWNSDVYDVPYVIARIQTYVGEEEALTALCRDFIPARKKEIPDRFGKDTEITYKLFGRVSIDYMQVYKKFTFVELQSYALEAVCEFEKLGYGKVKYKGTLPEFYRRDFKGFLEYNVRDSLLLRDLDIKLGFMAMINQLSHDSCCRLSDVLGTVVLTDQALMVKAHHDRGQVIPDKGANVGIPEYISTVAKMSASSDKYAGALVYDMDEYDENNDIISTKKGLIGYSASMDVTSEYPNSIISNNISIETVIWNARRENGDILWADKMNYRRENIYDLQKEMDNLDIRKDTKVVGKKRKKGKKDESPLRRTYVLKEAEYMNDFSRVERLESYTWGARNDIVGLIPEILMGWFEDRLHQKAKMEEHWKAKIAVLEPYNIDIKHIPKDDELKKLLTTEEFESYKHHAKRESDYNRLQHLTKIKLNSLYGATGNPHSHFYNVAVAEACTLCGQGIVTFMMESVAEVIDGTRNIRAECIQYGDTDSVYFRLPKEITNDEDAVLYADYVAEEVVKKFHDYMKKTHNCKDWQADRINAGREVVSDRSLFTEKKRYAMHLINKDGKPCDKLKIMGLEVIKSTTPTEIKKFLNELLDRMLTKKQNEDELASYILEFRKKFETLSLADIGEPKNVRGINDYKNRMEVRAVWDRSKTDGNVLLGEKGITREEKKILKNAQEDKDRWEKIIQLKNGVFVPGHVRASLNWNNYLDSIDDNITPRIKNGTKIKTYYLKKKNHLGIENIAIPTDLDDLPEWFENLPFDMDRIEQNLIDSKVEILYNSIGWRIPTQAQAEMENAFIF